MSISDNNNTAVTWWEVDSRNSFGEAVYDLPQTVSGFWRDEQVEFIDSQSQKVFSQAVVILGGCWEDIKEGDFIRCGETSVDDGDLTDPTGISGAFKIRRVRATTDFGNDERAVVLYV